MQNVHPLIEQLKILTKKLDNKNDTNNPRLLKEGKKMVGDDSKKS